MFDIERINPVWCSFGHFCLKKQDARTRARVKMLIIIQQNKTHVHPKSVKSVQSVVYELAKLEWKYCVRERIVMSPTVKAFED